MARGAVLVLSFVGLLSSGAAFSETRRVSLNDAVQLALKGNLSLMGTVDGVQSAQISEGLAASRFGVKFTPTFGQGFGSDSAFDQRYGMEVSKRLPFGTSVTAGLRSDLGSGELGNLATSNWGVTVTQPLLRGFGRTSAEFDLTNSRRALEGSERNLDVAKQRLAVDVVSNYYNIVRQLGLLDIAQKSLERSQELLRASEARLKVGLASKLDVLRADLQISQAQEALINRREALEAGTDNFKFTLGLGPGEEVSLETEEPDFQPIAIDIEDLVSQAFANRIELKEERDRVKDARRALSVSKQNMLPPLDLNVSYQERGFGPSLSGSFDFSDRGLNVFFTTSYTLDHSSESAALGQAQIQMEARARSVKQLEFNIANEVRAAARNLERVGRSIEIQERSIDSAEKQYRYANLRYQRGLANNFDVIDAENNLIQARSNYVSLLADHHVARTQLRRVVGTLDVERDFAPGRNVPHSRHHH